jgi:hypothetical protein
MGSQESGTASEKDSRKEEDFEKSEGHKVEEEEMKIIGSYEDLKTNFIA